jgi:hypothetical protein
MPTMGRKKAPMPVPKFHFAVLTRAKAVFDVLSTLRSEVCVRTAYPQVQCMIQICLKSKMGNAYYFSNESI